MHPVLKSLLRSLGFDPDNPQMVLDMLATSLGANPDEIREFPAKLVGYLDAFDKRLTALQTAVDQIDMQLKAQQLLISYGEPNAHDRRAGNGKHANGNAGTVTANNASGNASADGAGIGGTSEASTK